jgi:hypothetical protein
MWPPACRRLDLEVLEDRVAAAVASLAGTQGSVTALVVDDVNVYWAEDRGVIGRVPKAGGAATLLSAPGIRDLVTDGTFLYYTDGDAIWKLAAFAETGETRTPLANAATGLVGHPNSLAISLSAPQDALYATNFSGFSPSTVFRIDKLNGQTKEVDVVGSRFTDITALNRVGGGVAWIQESNGTVYEYEDPRLNGTPRGVVRGSGTSLNGPQTVAYDGNGLLYMLEGNGVIATENPGSGGNLLIRARDGLGAHGGGLAVDQFEGNVYYATQSGDIAYFTKPRALDQSAPPPTKLVTNANATLMASDGRAVYWASLGSSGGSGYIGRADKPQVTSFFSPVPASSPAAGDASYRVVATDAGGEPRIRVFDRGEATLDFLAYEPGFRGGVRIAVGDVTRDGTPDFFTAPGPGGGPLIRGFDGSTGEQLDGPLGLLTPYALTFRGGCYIAMGDVDGDGVPDLLVGADRGGGPHVRAFSGRDGSELRNFFAYAPTFRGGVRVAAGDVNGDGTADMITAAGPGGGPHVTVFDGKTLETLTTFFAYAPTFRLGIYVAAGDVDGDGDADVLTGVGTGGGPHVRALDGRTGQELTNLFAFDPVQKGGVRIGAADVNGDGQADLIAAGGPGDPPLVKSIDVESGTTIEVFAPFDLAFRGGVFVAGV